MDLEHIDWEASRQAMRKELKRKRRVDIKLLCNQCGLNKTFCNRQQQDNHRCPLCDEEREGRNHPLTFPHSKATKVWLKRQKS